MDIQVIRAVLKGFGSWMWAAGLAIALWLSPLAPATAQTLAPAPAPEPTASAPHNGTLSSGDIPSEKVSQFVRAYLAVVSLVEAREGELQSAETEVEYQRLAQAIHTEAMATIRSADLTPQEYLQLLELAKVDPDFGERIATQLQEAIN